MNVLVTGAQGFIGRNLVSYLQLYKDVTVIPIVSQSSPEELQEGLRCSDTVYHLAGVNRPKMEDEFESINVGFTTKVCNILLEAHCSPLIVMASSVQAERNNPYGISKRHAEEVLKDFSEKSGSKLRICRLRNVFGKGCRPNYNSVVATYCYNVANGVPIQVHNPDSEIELVYIDDAVQWIVHGNSVPFYKVSIKNLAESIQKFPDSYPNPSTTFLRQLYATYLSYVP